MRDFSTLKICFLAGTLEHGGAERQLFYMLQALCRFGVAPRLLSLDRGQFWEEPIRSLGVPVTWVGQRQSRLGRLLYILREWRANPPDLLQSQHFFANGYVALAAPLLRIRAIGAMRNEGTAELEANGRLGGWLNLHLPRLIAANSRLAIQQAVERGIPHSRLHFLPNVVDTQRFRPADQADRRLVSLLTAGRVVRQKRFDLFISALGRLRNQFRLAVRGWIAGPVQDRELRQELEQQARSLGLLPESLQFLGAVSDMGPLYQQADICVLTSDFEGTPNVLLEAMASGLPVVTTKVGGVPDIVQEGKTGFLVERDDADGLVSALAGLAIHSSRRIEMGRLGHEYIEEHHSLNRLPAYLEELYDRALPARSARNPASRESAPYSGAFARLAKVGRVTPCAPPTPAFRPDLRNSAARAE